MSEYENQLIREATEGPSFQEVHEDYLEPEPEETNDSLETGEQGELTPPRGFEYFGKRDCWGMRQIRHIATGMTSQEYDKGR